MIEGRCLCGAVGFRVSGPVSGIVCCHCSMCRRAAGGAFGAFFVANTRDIAWQGEAALVRRLSSPGLVRSFCGRCGTAMTGANLSEPDDTFILAASALGDPSGLEVIAHEHVASKAGWHVIADAAPQYAGGFPGWETLKP